MTDEIRRVADALAWPFLPPDDETIDDRVSLLAKHYPLEGKRVLEPGCFDGFLTVALAQAGANVVAFDVRPLNVIRAITRGLVRGVHVDVRVGDVHTMTDDYRCEEFDLLFHSGLFYHLADPVSHMRTIASKFHRIALDTHTARPGETIVKLNGYAGHWYQEFGWNDPLSGTGDRSFWLTEESLESLIHDCGLTITERLIRNPESKNGPRSFYLLESTQA